MSFNRENVIWQSANGLWNRGFFTCTENWWMDDPDPEWDVEYDTTTFEWAATGLASEDKAVDVWDGPNPGGWTTYEYATGTREQCNRFDGMAAELKQRAKENRT